MSKLHSICPQCGRKSWGGVGPLHPCIGCGLYMPDDLVKDALAGLSQACREQIAEALASDADASALADLHDRANESWYRKLWRAMWEKP